MQAQNMMNAEAIAPIVIAIAAKIKSDGVCEKLKEDGWFEKIASFITDFLSTIFPGIIDIITTFINMEDLLEKVCNAVL